MLFKTQSGRLRMAKTIVWLTKEQRCSFEYFFKKVIEIDHIEVSRY